MACYDSIVVRAFKPTGAAGVKQHGAATATVMRLVQRMFPAAKLQTHNPISSHNSLLRSARHPVHHSSSCQRSWGRQRVPQRQSH